MSDDMERTVAAKEAHENELMALPNVVSVGVGMRSVGGEYTNEIAIIVSVSEKYPSGELDAADVIPSEIEGIPVDVQHVGTISAGAG